MLPSMSDAPSIRAPAIGIPPSFDPMTAPFISPGSTRHGYVMRVHGREVTTLAGFANSLTERTTLPCRWYRTRRASTRSVSPASALVAAGERVEHEGHGEIECLVTIERVGAEAPVAERPEDGAQDEMRQGVRRNVGADLAACLSELDEWFQNPMRRGDGESLGARPDLENGAPGELAAPRLVAHHRVEQRVERLAKGAAGDHVGEEITRAAEAL